MWPTCIQHGQQPVGSKSRRCLGFSAAQGPRERQVEQEQAEDSDWDPTSSELGYTLFEPGN